MKRLPQAYKKLLFERRVSILGVTSCLLTLSIFLKSRSPPHQLIWVPHVASCQNGLCFPRSVLSESIPSDQAQVAHEYLKEYARKQPDVPIPHFLVQNSGKPSLSECSVVGGSPTSPDPSHSEIIDSAPTIRLNVRYPPFLQAEGVPTRLGSRTDILLVQRNALRTLERYTNGWGQGNATLGHLRFLAGETFTFERPVLLYRTECPTDAKACIESLTRLNVSTTSGRLPIWLIHHDVEIMARAALRRFGLRRGKIPSTGMAAIMIALRMCKRVNIFAMNGSIAEDGDFHDLPVWRGHTLNSEREFVHWLSTCSRLQNLWCGRVKVFS